MANVPTVQFQDVREMDTNKNGKVEKSEFLAATGVQFDKAAGEKGYCTYQEITDGLRAVQEWWRHSQ